MTDERFLVTGAFGCVGAWTVRELIREGTPVVGFDLGTNSRRLAQILEPDELQRVTLVTGDITDLAAIERVIDEQGITNVVHLAALQVPFCRADPPLGAAVNVVGTVNVFVPGRLVDDYAGALLRFDNGARGILWVTQAAGGVENGLRIRVSGTKGSLEWNQEEPTRLIHSPIGHPAEVRTPNGPGTLPLAARSTRIVAGHPEAFLEAFANIYSDAAEAIAARRSGTTADPLALHFPDVHDGVVGIRFVQAVIESSRAGGAWTDAGTLSR